MPLESGLQHRHVRSANLPYQSNRIPTDTTPAYLPGSQDILTNIQGWAQRRPGFADFVEPAPTTFTNLQRVFTWDNTSDQFFVMFCDVTATQSKVYKLQVGQDQSAVLIYTDAVPEAFDFSVSNNVVYFSNGNSAKKWNPSLGIQNWGIAIGSVNNATGPNGPTTAQNYLAYGNTAWNGVTNITAEDGLYATVTLTGGMQTINIGPNMATSAVVTGFVAGQTIPWTSPTNALTADGQYASATFFYNQNGIGADVTDNLNVTGFGFNVPSTATITGIKLEVLKAVLTTVGSFRDSNIRLMKAGSATGNNKASATNWPSTASYSTYGSSTDLWGTTWTPADVNASNFGVTIAATEISGLTKTQLQCGIDNVRITVTYTTAPGTQNSDPLVGGTFNFSIPSTTTITGLKVEVKGFQGSASVGSANVYVTRAGNLAGAPKTGIVFGTTNGYVSLGGQSDLWGLTWTPSDLNSAYFGIGIIAVNPTLSNATFSIDFIRVTVYGVGGPTVTPTGSGTFSATTGYQYVFCYGNSVSGHISSPSPPSASTGAFTNKLNVTVALTASSDPQVNQIHVFRSTDAVSSGTTAPFFFEIPGSPYLNVTANITDSASDTQLSPTSIAPIPTLNDPPSPGRRPVYFAGRIWMIVGNDVVFSALEENTIGVPEESFPSGVAGNYWTFDEAPQTLFAAGQGDAQGLGILCGGRLYGIEGNTLDTFRRFIVASRRGCRSIAGVSQLGGMAAWADSAHQVWATNGSSLEEMSVPIRPDLEPLDFSKVSTTFHVMGRFNWFVMSTGSQLWVYDLDAEQWMPPWNFACNYVFSGETSPGNYVLMACTPTTALQLSPAAHNDKGATYTPIARTNLDAMVQDFPGYGGMYEKPSGTGMPWYFQIDANNIPIADVSYIKDDDPMAPGAVYTSITSQQTSVEVVANRTNGVNLVQSVYAMTKPYSRWIGWQWKGAQADDSLTVYGWFTAYQEKK